jgi:YesN/AraC family two-component response regulator
MPDAFSFHAFGYLVKPLKKEEFNRCFSKAAEECEKRDDRKVSLMLRMSMLWRMRLEMYPIFLPKQVSLPAVWQITRRQIWRVSPASTALLVRIIPRTQLISTISSDRAIISTDQF